jgi:hypothetical protein
VIEPLLPEVTPKPNGGRPRIDDCAALTGILFVLKKRESHRMNCSVDQTFSPLPS